MRYFRKIQFLPFYLIWVLLFLHTCRYPFFWDTVQLASRHASYFYTTNFSSIILPAEIDSGHIPTLGIYLAAVWKLFGRSLLASHLAMVPFLAGILWQVQNLVQHLFSRRWQFFAMAIILADATLLAQSTLVSPDIILVFFFLLALNSLLTNRKYFFMLAISGLVLASMRGMLCAAGFFAARLILQSADDRAGRKTGFRLIAGSLWKVLPDFIPGALIALTFFSWHYHSTGWIAFHKDMPWSSQFEISGVHTAARNIFIVAWRLVDFGRLFIWLAAIFLIFHYLKSRPALPGSICKLIIILIPVFFFLVLPAIIFKGLTGHRYFLPLYLMISLLVSWYLLEIFSSALLKRTVLVVLAAGLISGNFWVYPDTIAEGWDSTLGYMPYFPLRAEMIKFMEDEGIAFEKTGTLFPNLGRLDYIDLSGEQSAFAELDLSANQYIFYSNIFNDFPDSARTRLKDQWVPLKDLRRSGVKVILYGRIKAP